MPTSVKPDRVAWVDYVKGICIILVVMMHSTLGVEKAAGGLSALNGFIEWARPFRMPDFFLISGLFLAARIDRPWRSYLDSKVLHFAYFYVLWMTIQFAMKAPGFVAERGLEGTALFYLESFVEPLGTLWFIYLLAIFFVVAKLARPLPALAVWLVAAGLEAAAVETGHLVIDEFCARFVYFYSGYLAAPFVFSFASRLRGANWAAVLAGLLVWGAVNLWAVAEGYAVLPGVSLLLGFIGAGAVIATATLAERSGAFGFLSLCGRNSIVIYLAFFAFMAATRVILLRLGIVENLTVISLLVTTAGVVGPLLLHRLVKGTRMAFLFERPAAFRLTSGSKPAVGRAAEAQQSA